MNYLREDRTLLRRSTFPSFAPFTRHNLEIGAWIEDRWTPHTGLLLEPGLRYDWDEIIRRPLLLPAHRLQLLSARRGKHDQIHRRHRRILRAHPARIPHPRPRRHSLRHLLRRRRNHTHRPTARNHLHRQHFIPPRSPRAQLERRRPAKAPAQIYLGVNFMQKRLSDDFVYANQSGSSSALRQLHPHQQPPGSLLLRGNRRPPLLLRQLRPFRLVHPLFSHHQLRPRLCPHLADPRPAAERPALLGCPQSRHLLGLAPRMASRVGALVCLRPPQLGLRLHPRLALRLSL